MTDMLNLPSLRVLEVREDPHQYSFLAETDSAPTGCAKCQGTHLVIHSRRRQVYLDTPSHGRMVTIALDRLRWLCRGCGAITQQPLDDMADQHQMTRRLVAWVERSALRRTFAEVARETGLDERTVRRITADHLRRLEAAHTFRTPAWLGLDEIHIIGRARGVVADVGERRMVDLLPDRNKPTIANHLRTVLDPSRIEVVTMDMWRPYRDVVRAVCPRAEVVVDKFHVVRMATQALDTVRKGLRASQPRRLRIQLKDDRFILNKRFAALSLDQRETLEAWSRLYPELGQAWVAKESFYDLRDCPSAKEARICYRFWLAELPAEIREPFAPLVRAMGNWENEVWAYFSHRATNAYVEALNGVIRVVNRLGRGYSFDVLRARMLFGHTDQAPAPRLRKRQDAFFPQPGGLVGLIPATFGDPDPRPVAGVSLATLADLIERGAV